MELAPTSTVRLSVRRLLSILGNGATIFSAVDEAGNAIRVIAPPNVFVRAPVTGESWLVNGGFRNDGKYGLQLHATSVRYELPRGHLLTHYLSEHPDFRGIGEGKAARLWEEFGERLSHVLSDGLTDELERVVSPSLARSLVDTWAHKREEAETVEFLDAHGLDLRMATTLRRVWGTKTRELLQRNPYYLLALASWRRVDSLGAKLGIAADDDRRLVGAVESCLYDRLQWGHTVASSGALEAALAGRIDRRLVKRAIEVALAEGAVCGNSVIGYQAFGAWALENGIASRIRSMLSGEQRSQAPLFPMQTLDGWTAQNIRAVETAQGFRLNDEQGAAVVLPFEHQFCLLTGGAGVGKTTVLRVVLQLAEAQNLSVLQMALAGRAAQRMEEATRHPAMTIAKFLSAVRSGRLEVTAESLIVIDEASMLDLPTLYRILQHMPDGAGLMLVGDSAQLPPIGFGLAFHRLVGSAKVPQVQLRTVHRQAASSGIPTAASDVREHLVPRFVPFEGKHAGVSFIDCDLDGVMPLLRTIVQEWAGEDWQVLAAVKGGRAGTRFINGSFHAQAANAGPQDSFVPGEPVIHLLNDYERSLMNGALGRVVSVEADGALQVSFDGDMHVFRPDEVSGRIELAYAISVHKAQGSQFGRVVIVLSKSRLLDHSLVYTALTRGVEQVVIIGSREAFESAVVSPPIAQRREVAFDL
ncbi:AAA family ATPase [Paraburkholderia sp. RL17-337-BIB-A]|uniref:AAA family ATPase n=1 Tax=Paraburkholderia sp. RL17-337-BIB-A TaxID=3031636 RepID=UPI0038B88AB3